MNKQKTLIFSLSAMLFLTASFLVYSWSEPEATMPGTYTPPINTSATAQTKSGDFSATSFVDANNPSYYLNPSGNSVVSGKIVMEDSTVSIDAPTTVATKGYVDENASSLPEGGEIGATLIMTSQGPMWNNFLTWAGSTRTIFECDQIGGTVFDTGSGTICRYPGATIPSGWSQAAYWQRYNSSVWGGDACGNHKSTGPDTFSNQAANALTYNLSLSSYWPNPCATHPEWWWVAFTGYDGHPVVADSLTTSNNRAEIGLY